MRHLGILALLCSAGCGPLYLRVTTIQFHSDDALVAKSGSWHAVEAADAPSPPLVWMQQASSGESEFNLALCETNPPLNGDVHVFLRAVEGQHDQGGGLVWRARDERNYYLARWNPLEGNLRAYKVIDGVRTQILDKPVQADAGWHKLRVWFMRDRIEIWFDEKSTGEFGDATILTPGMVGVWTKSDARTQFDDLEIREL
jgi:hypothetical protein